MGWRELNAWMWRRRRASLARSRYLGAALALVFLIVAVLTFAHSSWWGLIPLGAAIWDGSLSALGFRLERSIDDPWDPRNQ